MSNAPRSAAIILAAGASERFGASNKLVARLAGKPVIMHAVENVLEAQVNQVIVVTGRYDTEIRSTLNGLPIEFILNGEHPKGIATSIAAGIGECDACIDAAAILLGDMPSVPASVIRDVLAHVPAKGIAAPTHHGKRGHPVVFAREHFSALTKLTGDRGAAQMIADNGFHAIPTTCAGVLQDIDTMDDLKNAQTSRKPD